MLLESNVYKNEKKKEFIDLAEKFILNMSNSRSLYGNDLARLFKLIKQLQMNQHLSQDGSQYDKLMMNVCSNLRTLSLDLLYDASENVQDNADHISDLNFKKENEARFEREREAKSLIFDMYKGIFERSPDLFRKHQEYSLSPLSSLMAELFNDLSP